MAKKRAAVRVIDLQETLDNLHIRHERTQKRNGNTVIIREVPVIVVVPVSGYEEHSEVKVRTSRRSTRSQVDTATEFPAHGARRSQSREEVQSTKSLTMSSPTSTPVASAEMQSIGRSRSSDDVTSPSRKMAHHSCVVLPQNAEGKWLPKRHGWQRWTNGPKGRPPPFLDNDL